MARYNRVLVCGSRNWAEPKETVDPWRLKEPAFDPTSLESNMLCALLDGLYLNHDMGNYVAYIEPFVLIEGGAMGADSVAWWWATQSPTHDYDDDTRFKHLHFPAEWFDEEGNFRQWAGPERNKRMLEVGDPNLVIACSHDLENSRGTSHMVKIAKEAGVPVYVLGEA